MSFERCKHSNRSDALEDMVSKNKNICIVLKSYQNNVLMEINFWLYQQMSVCYQCSSDCSRNVLFEELPKFVQENVASWNSLKSKRGSCTNYDDDGIKRVTDFQCLRAMANILLQMSMKSFEIYV